MAKKVDKNEQPSSGNQDQPTDAPLKFLDADGSPTAEEFTEKDDPVTGQKIRTKNRMRPEATHGTIAPDPYGPLDSFGISREDAGPREIKSNQMAQVGEDPGRVFDSAGLHPAAAAQHTKAVIGDMARDPNIRARLQGQVPDRPTDTPGTTAAIQSDAEKKLTATGADNQPGSVVPSGAVPDSSAPPPDRTPIPNPQPGKPGEPLIT